MVYRKSFFERLRSFAAHVIAFSNPLKLWSVFEMLIEFRPPAWALAKAETASRKPLNPTLQQWLNPWNWLVWLGSFMLEWMRSRPYLNIPLAVPSLITLVFVVGVVGVSRGQRRQARVSQYQNLLSELTDQADWDHAEIVLSALIDMDPANVGLRYERALLYERQGARAKAEEQMQRLVAFNKYAPSALWLITNTIDLRNAGGWDLQTHYKFRALTDVVRSEGRAGDRQKAEVLMGSYLLAINAKRDAAKYLGDAATRNPELALSVAILHNELGEKAQSRNFAEIARAFLSQKVASEPSSVVLRKELSRALALLDQEDLASQVLMEGNKITKDDSLRVLAGEVFIYRVRRSRAETGNAGLLARLVDIRSALQLAPDSQTVTDEVINVLFECKNSSSGEIVTLRSALAKGLDPNALHFVKGTLALFDNKFEEAKRELELATADGLEMPGVLNNLAMAMLQSDNVDLASALNLSNVANDLLPDHPYLRDTRGQILMRLERYRDAVPDLEFALKAEEIAKQVHQQLAIAYRELGNHELAKTHESLAK